EPGIDAAEDGDGRDAGAERERAVDREVREIEDAEGEKDAEADEGVDEADLDCPEKGNGTHSTTPPSCWPARTGRLAPEYGDRAFPPDPRISICRAYSITCVARSITACGIVMP